MRGLEPINLWYSNRPKRSNIPYIRALMFILIPFDV